ncbi:hypothetical protein QFZ21_000299 [Microbacterium sp. W4I20]|nr:hypothetical protein [Microbacterium sp. W4I20]
MKTSSRGAGVRREVGQRREAAERLSEHGPGRGAQVLPQRLAVAHDGVGAQVREVLGDDRCAPVEIRIADRCGPAGAALVDQYHPIVGERLVEPRRRRRRMEGTGRLMARATLEEDQVGEGFAALPRDDRGEHVDRPSVGGIAPDEGNGERVLLDGEIEKSAGAGLGGHHITFPM